MARGKDDFADGYVDEKISISNYPLSASVACGKVREINIYSLLSNHIRSSFAVHWKSCGTSSDCLVAPAIVFPFDLSFFLHTQSLPLSVFINQPAICTSTRRLVFYRSHPRLQNRNT